MDPQDVPKVLVLEQQKVGGLIRLTAYLEATEKYTTVEEEEPQSFFEYGFSAVTRTKLLKIETNDVLIEIHRKKLLKDYLEIWQNKASRSPAEAVAFLEKLELKKRTSQDLLDRKYRMVIKGGQEAAAAAGTAAKAAMVVKFASTVTNTILSNFTPAGFVITYLQDNAMGYCSTLAEAQKADAIAISDAALTQLPEAGMGGASYMLENGAISVADKIAKWAEARHYEMYKALRGANYSVSAKAALKTTDGILGNKALKASKMMGSTRGISVLGKKIPGISIVFAVKGIIDSVSTLQEDLKKVD